MYNERGYINSGNSSNPENLSVSPSTGAVQYSYPLESYPVNGVIINPTLNYVSSVSYTSFSYYMDNNWHSFPQNRPAWILGINGFAVQAFSFSSMFVNRPDILNDGGTSAYACSTWSYINSNTYTDKDLNWVMDGYDYCNSMKDFKSNNHWQDYIKLLRADGSILELRNAKKYDPSEGSSEEILKTILTGNYYENSVNSKGIAKVEYAGEDWQLGFTGTVWNNAYRPRILRYFPGDGLEYVFKESVLPFGFTILNADYSGTQLTAGLAGKTFGRVGASPTIFYLETIRKGPKNIVNLNYNRLFSEGFNVDGDFKTWNGSTARCVFKSLPGLKFQIDGNACIKINGKILLKDRTIEFHSLKNDIKVLGLNTEKDKEMSVLNITRFTELLDASKIIGLNAVDYYSIVPYISSIKEIHAGDEINDKITFFRYEKYKTIYKASPYSSLEFPKQCSTDVGTLGFGRIILNNLRLIDIKEPALRYQMSYKNRTIGSQSNCSYVEDNDNANCYNTSHTINLSGSVTTDEFKEDILNNMVEYVNKYNRKSKDNTSLGYTDAEMYIGGVDNGDKIMSEKYIYSLSGTPTTFYLSKHDKTQCQIEKFNPAGSIVPSETIDKEYQYQFLEVPVLKDLSTTQRNLIYPNLFSYMENYPNLTGTNTKIIKYNIAGRPNGEIYDINLLPPSPNNFNYTLNESPATAMLKNLIVPLCSHSVMEKTIGSGVNSYTKEYVTYEYDFRDNPIGNPNGGATVKDFIASDANVRLNTGLYQKSEKIWVSDPSSSGINTIVSGTNYFTMDPNAE